MAIDTREKRQSIAGVPTAFVGPNVTPNASKDTEWKQQVAWNYSGIPPFILLIDVAIDLEIAQNLQQSLEITRTLDVMAEL